MPAPGGPEEEEAAATTGPPRRRLFQEEDGSGLRFYLRPGAAKAELAPLILREGGRLCRVQEPGAVLLAPPGEGPGGAPGGFVSTRYVTDCVARRERLPLAHYRLPPGPPARATASQSKEAMDQTHVAEESKAQNIFQMANKEFEDREGDGENHGPAEDAPPEQTQLKTSDEAAPPTPKVRVLESVPGTSSAVPQNQAPVEEQPLGPSAAEVAMAVKDMKHFMGKFGMDLATVTQVFLKNSGEVEAVASCLQTGQRADGSPLWSRQDDVDLLKSEGDFRSKLVAKYGAENVTRRVAFRKS